MAREKATSIEKIQAAASQLFEQHGYANTTLDDIATAVGVTKPTIYQYVSSKQALLEGIVWRMLTELDAGLTRILESEQRPSARLRAALRFCAELAVDDPGYYKILSSEWPELSTAFRREFRRWGDSIAARFQRLLAACRAEGVLSTAVDERVGANLIFGMTSTIGQWFTSALGFTAEQVGDQAFELITRPVGRRPRS